MSDQFLTSIAAVSGEAKQVMLEDGTLLAIRAFFDETGRETENFDGCKSFLVVDHRTVPPTMISIQTDAIEYTPEA